MNNSQFRKLVLDTPARQPGTSSGSSTTPLKRDGATPSGALGSRMRSSIPMTPRSIATSGGVDFRRQLAERDADATQKAQKRFRAVAAPKGVKLPSGYVDRAKGREGEAGEGEESDKAARVQALEEMMKLQQIDRATFERLRDEIVGGDVGSVHLVKGLDYKLLERVRRGEDVLNGVVAGGDGETEGAGVEDGDVEEELEALQEKDVAPVEREKVVKRGEMAPPSALLPGRKRNRDQILAEMKAARLAAKQGAKPSLGARFKKVGATATGSRIERDNKGREVLITVDEDGNEKRKVRKVQPDEVEEKGHGLLMPDKDAAPLGMEVPDIPKVAEEEEEDVDIFEDAGDDYDPLAGLEEEADDDDDGDSAAGESTTLKTTTKEDPDASDPTTTTTSPEKPTSDTPSSMPPPPVPIRPRNYFNDPQKATDSTTPPQTSNTNPISDPAVLAALRKASTLHQASQPTDPSTENTAASAARTARLKHMLQDASHDRDAADLDLGFGSSRAEDEEDFGEESIKLSRWADDGDGDGDDDGKGDGKGAKGKRKRGQNPTMSQQKKKKKGKGGDVNSAADVLRVMERRRGEAGVGGR